jgi:membrane protein
VEAPPPARVDWRTESTAFLKDFWARLQASDLFFMAGAITFNVLVAMVPLLLLAIGLGGMAVSAFYEDPTTDLLQVVLTYLPVVGGDIQLVQTVGGVIEGVVQERTGYTVIGFIVLAWVSTRLVGTLRIVLRDVFEVEADRGVLAGKLFDLKVVVFFGLLLFLNVGVTLAVRAVQAFGLEALALADPWVGFLRSAVGYGLSFMSAWVLFYLLYWYLPARKVAWRTAAVGATFTAVLYEVLKEAFAWYVTEVANFTTAYGSLSVAAILFFWIYYSAVVFIVGGLVARSYELGRKRRMDRSRLRTGGAGAAALLTLLFVPAAVGAQTLAPFGGNGNGGNGNGGLLDSGAPVVMADRSLEREMVLERPLVDHDGPYVVVHLAENRVFVMEGRSVVWSAPAGTGHGFQLEGQGQEWTFTTPIGMFQVLRKEKDPVWILPDWWYVQRDFRIPDRNDPSRRVTGALGTSALFLGDGIAIHGTDRPDLLLHEDPEMRRVSHGCIRLTNEGARQLYHLVDVGTPVLIY